MPSLSRCLGIPQATDRLPKILQAGTQFRDCPHQSVQEVSGIAEARPPASGGIHPGDRVAADWGMLVSVELDEIMSLSDRILVIADGRIVGELDGAKADERTIGLMMANIVPDDVAASQSQGATS